MSRTADGTVAAPEAALVDALRRGDADAFGLLVNTHHASLRRVARLYVPDALVDEVVQETWAGVVRGIDRFEGRSSLKTWIYRILVNQARKRGGRERRTVPFSGMSMADDDALVSRLTHPLLGAGYWASAPNRWQTGPEDETVAAELRRVIRAAIDALPDAQREVITLRDVEGWTAEEVCDALCISAVNQRVRLHRARVTVRAALEVYFDGE